jgi:hypothetical protein
MSCKTPITTAHIRIDEPCEADWSAMTPSEGKRFCSLCTQDVHDLSSLTRDQALAVIRTASKPCVRYTCNEEGEILFKEPTPKVRAVRSGGLRRGMRLAAMLGLSLVGGRAHASMGLDLDQVSRAVDDARSWIASRAVEVVRPAPVPDLVAVLAGESGSAHALEVSQVGSLRIAEVMGGATFIPPEPAPEPVVEPTEVTPEQPVKKAPRMGRMVYRPPADQD